MARVQLALYRGPGTTLAHRLSHALTVVVLTLRCLRWSPWSHAELVVDALFFFDQNHCLSAWQSERNKQQLPGSYRG